MKHFQQISSAFFALLFLCLCMAGCRGETVKPPVSDETNTLSGDVSGETTFSSASTEETLAVNPGTSTPTDKPLSGTTASSKKTTGKITTVHPTEGVVTPIKDPRYPLKVADINKVAYAFNNAEIVQPFWLGNVMYNESLTMIQRGNGEINGKLLFTPTRIVSVYDNSLKKTYKEGVDYVWVKGTNTLKWLNNSAIPYFTQNDLNGKDENGNPIKDYDGTWDAKGRAAMGGQLYCVGNYLYDKQIAVTYTYDETKWKGTNATYQGNKLPNVVAKLKSKTRPHIVIYGDSIFTGCESSALWGRDPRTPMFPDLIKYALKDAYGVIPQITNPSVGGKDSAWGRDNAQALVADKSPDLVLIGFGMNDSAATSTLANTKAIMQTIKQKNPKCEFILYSSIVPNKRAGFLIKQDTYGALYKTLEGPGVAVVDIYAMHEEILKAKDYISTTGNNINHPNDWIARMYAMNAAATLIDYSK